jgi:2-keto-4-pentenoate hydratase
MMNDARCLQAAGILWDHWQDGTRLDRLPADVRPSTRADGYAIQACFERRSVLPLFGWKIAATSAAGQRHINVDGPLAGRLLAERVLGNEASVSLANCLMRVAEVELAFRLGADLPPRAQPYRVDEVMAAVATLHPAIEIPDSRYTDFCAVGAPQLIADNACAHLFVLGAPANVPWRRLDLAAHEVSAVVEGKSRHAGKGANVLGDPRLALTWIANELSSLGLGLAKGQVVTTGTCVVPVDVVPGDRFVASYGDFGRLAVNFT